MAKPVRNSLGPLLLHHGCDRSLAKLVLEGKTSPIPSENKYDWLGPGIYFYRPLDCLVIKMVHKLREESGLEAYDSVYGIFVEGQELFPGSGFKAKSHAQIAIRNPECIAGYFRVPDFT